MQIQLIQGSPEYQNMWRNVVVRRLISYSQSNRSQHSSTELGFLVNRKCHGVRSSSSASASDSATGAAADPFSLIRHYGRCYWELSKARLRFMFITNLNNFFFFKSIIRLFCIIVYAAC